MQHNISIFPFHHPFMLAYHPTEMIRLHASRGLCTPASTHRLQNHSKTPPQQSGSGGARPAPSVSCQEGTWEHRGCWARWRAPTICWHFREVRLEGRSGVRNTVRIHIKNQDQVYCSEWDKLCLSAVLVTDFGAIFFFFFFFFLPDWTEKISVFISVFQYFSSAEKFMVSLLSYQPPPCWRADNPNGNFKAQRFSKCDRHKSPPLQVLCAQNLPIPPSFPLL